jgi:hypothetical protein
MLITLIYCVLYIIDYHKSFGAIELIINVVWCIFWLSAAACGAHLVDETSGWTDTMFNFAAIGLTNEEAGKIADIVAKVEVYNNQPPSIGRKLLAGRALLSTDYQRKDLQIACAFAWLSWFLWIVSTWYSYKDCKIPGQGLSFLERWIPRDVIGHKIATIGASATFTVKGGGSQSMKKGGSFMSNGRYSPQRSSGSHISVPLGSHPAGKNKSTSHSRSPSRSPERSPTKRSQSIPPEMGGMMPEVSAPQAVRVSSSSQQMIQSPSRSQQPSAAQQQPSRSRSSSQHRSSSNGAPRQPGPEGASPSRSPSRRGQQMTQEEYELYMARKRSQQQQQLHQQPGQHRSSSSSGHRRPSSTSSSPTKRTTEGGEARRSGSRSPSKRAEGEVRRSSSSHQSSGERMVRSSSSSRRVQK